MKKYVEFVISVGGIYLGFLLAGVVHEQIYSSADAFVYPEFLVLCQFICCYFTTVFIRNLVPSLAVESKHGMRSPVLKVSDPDSARWLKIAHAFGSVSAILLTNTALTYVSYPTQALAKSCKVLPVMMGGFFVKSNKYSISEYLSVFLVTTGILMFNLMGSKQGGSDTLIGLLLLFSALFCDGITSYLTERVRTEFHPTGLATMEYVSMYGSLFMLPIVVIADQFKATSVLDYLVSNPHTLNQLVLYSLVAAFGQIFIFRVIAHFGNLTLAIVTTTRKFFSVMLSILIFSHILTMAQWCCVLLVLSGSSLDFYGQLSHKKSTDKPL
mmetsp:Transcript_19935/g.36853  ORF Transcript_19935/g.36853 Transcript_19935/m.36853 type:complete len:326 (-) Transcript_19935:182-1159(-)